MSVGYPRNCAVSALKLNSITPNAGFQKAWGWGGKRTENLPSQSHLPRSLWECDVMLSVWWAERIVVCDVAGKYPPPLGKLPHPPQHIPGSQRPCFLFFSFFFLLICILLIYALAYWHEKETVLKLLQSIVQKGHLKYAN